MKDDLTEYYLAEGDFPSCPLYGAGAITIFAKPGATAQKGPGFGHSSVYYLGTTKTNDDFGINVPSFTDKKIQDVIGQYGITNQTGSSSGPAK